MIKNNLEYNQSTFPNSAFEDYLKKVLPEYFKDNQFNYDKFKQDLNANDISEFSDGYQLKFIGKDYARKQAGDKTTTVLVPNKEHNEKVENTNSKNLFFTGDNLEVLRHLRNAYTKKIDVIYIDPPYNTGNKDFIYPDKFDYSDEELESIFGITDEELIKFNNIKNSSSHSAWLTFMYPRLWLAKQLLTDEGVIFISIDDNEQAQLKLLMDDIFGESNFISEMIIDGTPKNDPLLIATSHEYVNVYVKNKKTASKKIWGVVNPLTDTILEIVKDKNFTDAEKDLVKFYKEHKLNKDNISNYKYVDEHGVYRIGPIDDPQGKGPKDKRLNLVTGNYCKVPMGGWRCNIDTWNKWIKNNLIKFPDNDNTLPAKKTYLTIDKLDVGRSVQKMQSRSTVNYLKSLFNNKKVFSNPKHIPLIKYLISLVNNKDITILDFFAGSATTADAVMQLNAEDNGNRKFIMVQLPEKTYEIDKNGNEVPTKGGKNAFELGYKTIDEVSRERIIRAAKKIKSEHEGTDDLDLGFKHYYCVEPKQDLVDEIVEFNPNEIELFNSNMIEPFSAKSLGVNSSSTGVDTILTTWLIDDGYDITNIDLTIDKINDYYVYKLDNERIYLIDANWNSNNTVELVNYLNNNPTYKSIILYGYSFSVNDLDELKNTINQLNNKVNLFVRY